MGTKKNARFERQRVNKIERYSKKQYPSRNVIEQT